MLLADHSLALALVAAGPGIGFEFLLAIAASLAAYAIADVALLPVTTRQRRPAIPIAILLVAIWALTGAGYFWPVWPIGAFKHHPGLARG